MVFLPSAATLIAFLLLGSPILGLAFGDFYRDAWPVLAILSIGQLVNVWVGSCGYLLVMTGHQRDMMRISTISCAVSTVGGLLAVREYGLVGVAIATAMGMIVQQTLMLLMARKRCGVWTHASPRFLVTPLLAGRRWPGGL